MMISSHIAIILAALLAAVAALNLYWAAGGSAGAAAAIPIVDGKPLFRPSRAGKIAAAFAFAAAAALALACRAAWLPRWLAVIAEAFVGALFLFRGVGEFRYFGAFKKVKDSAFARWDSRFYVPLSFAIGVMSLLLAFAATRPGGAP